MFTPTLVKHNTPIFSTKEKEILWNNQSKKTVKEQMWADVYEGERHANSLTSSLFQSHKRPERRKRQECAGWKRRELVFLKIKRAARRSERESGLTLSATSQLEGVCGCACASLRVCVLVEFRCCICPSVHPCLLILVYLLTAMRAR